MLHGQVGRYFKPHPKPCPYYIIRQCTWKHLSGWCCCCECGHGCIAS